MWVNPYIDGRNMEIHHARSMVEDLQHPWNVKSPLEVASVQGILDDSELHLGSDRVLRYMPILSAYQTHCAVVMVAFNRMNPQFNVSGDRLFDNFVGTISSWQGLEDYLTIFTVDVDRSTLASVQTVWSIAFDTCTWWGHARDANWLFSLRFITFMQTWQAVEAWQITLGCKIINKLDSFVTFFLLHYFF